MPVSDWADLMPQTVSIASLSSSGDYSKPTFGADTDYGARVVFKATMVKSNEGAEVMARGYAWINGLPTITPTDRVTLPDSSTPPILAVEKYPDDEGDHHVKVFFG